MPVTIMTVRAWREARDLTQEQLAARCGLSVSTIRDVERSAERSAAPSGEGLSPPRTFRARTRQAIATALEVSQIEIVEFQYLLSRVVLTQERSVTINAADGEGAPPLSAS
jgi:transcriptional regulator with XRE-family HTH domain